jgi:hypothetical protein
VPQKADRDFSLKIAANRRDCCPRDQSDRLAVAAPHSNAATSAGPHFWHGDCVTGRKVCSRNSIAQGRSEMRNRSWRMREGKIGWILLWLLGVPLPILFFLFLIRGCT